MIEENKTINQWDELSLEERKIENAMDEAAEMKRKIARIEDDYEELFAHTTHLAERLDKFSKNESDRYLFEDIQWQIRQKQKDVFHYLEDEKDTLQKELKELEDRDNEIFYEKKKMLVEEEYDGN
ncbi:DUF3958 family protein [uncultured Enterococcus sp.]|uniref:DUF3958 family protein n=1 Tax=uncultured Enterococcus sp. TaxID=167972 RepID=UPI002AA8BF30|nr:DUF3958 family protein [uncultured Enterococcus sp.]